MTWKQHSSITFPLHAKEKEAMFLRAEKSTLHSLINF